MQLFPPQEAALISGIVERDLPFYDARLSEAAVESINQYSRDVGLLKGAPSYAEIVATQYVHLW